MFMSMFNDTGYQRKQYEDFCMKNAREVASTANTCRVELHPNGPTGKLEEVATNMVCIFKDNTSHPTFSSMEPLWKGELVTKKWEAIDSFSSDLNNRLLFKTILAFNLLRNYNVICRWFGQRDTAQTPKNEDSEANAISSFHSSSARCPKTTDL